jgi:hypothetical protein
MRYSGLRAGILAALAVVVTIHGQTPSTGRVMGTVTDEGDVVLPGVKVELATSDGHQQTVTNSSGRYTFEGVRAGTDHRLTITLPGFNTEKRDRISVTPGETATIDVTLRIGCLATAHFVQAPILDELLTSDVALYLRVTEDGVEREVRQKGGCQIAKEANAVILDVVHASRPEWRPNAPIQLYSVNRRLRAGEEYLVFMNYNESLRRFLFDMRMFTPVKNGRVEWHNDGLLGLRDGIPIRTALQRLRDTRTRYTRYRQYGSLEPTTSIEELRYKTGWVAIGTMALKRDVWVDEWKDEPPFEFVAGSSAARPLPRRNDRIRLKKDSEAAILDFGWQGEALRHVSPTTRPRGTHVSDWTGARVAAGTAYTVADVTFEPIEESDRRIVWFKLVATAASN